MLRFIERTTPIKIKVKLPYIEDALETLAEVVDNYHVNSKSSRTSYLAIFNKLVNEIDDKEKAFILDIIQDWQEVQDIFDEKTDNFQKSVGASMKTGSINFSPSKSDKTKGTAAYKNSSADVQKKLDLLKKAGQSKPKPSSPKPPAPKPKPVPPKPSAPKPKQEDSEYDIPPLPGDTNGGTAWTPGTVAGPVVK
jgi:hypothetical protein